MNDTENNTVAAGPATDADGAPIFILHAGDQLATIALRRYVELAKQAGCDPAVIAMAHRHRLAMEEWARGHGCTLPTQRGSTS